MDIYDYMTNKGVEPYRLMKGLRYLFSDIEEEPIKKTHKNDLSLKESFEFAQRRYKKIVYDFNDNQTSGNIVEELTTDRNYQEVLKFMKEMKLIYESEYIGQTRIR